MLLFGALAADLSISIHDHLSLPDITHHPVARLHHVTSIRGLLQLVD